MQFCFVLFFSEVFPLAPLVALVNNIVLIRLMAYKVRYRWDALLVARCCGVWGVWGVWCVGCGVCGVWCVVWGVWGVLLYSVTVDSSRGEQGTDRVRCL